MVRSRTAPMTGPGPDRLLLKSHHGTEPSPGSTWSLQNIYLPMTCSTFLTIYPHELGVCGTWAKFSMELILRILRTKVHIASPPKSSRRRRCIPGTLKCYQPIADRALASCFKWDSSRNSYQGIIARQKASLLHLVQRKIA
jgi:hypothetical protein